MSIFRPFSAGRDWVGRKSPDRRLHAARVLILTRLCARIPWPIQILAPSVLSMRVRSQPHPRLRVLILPSPMRHLIVRRNAGRCSSARRPAEGCPCGRIRTLHTPRSGIRPARICVRLGRTGPVPRGTGPVLPGTDDTPPCPPFERHGSRCRSFIEFPDSANLSARSPSTDNRMLGPPTIRLETRSEGLRFGTTTQGYRRYRY